MNAPVEQQKRSLKDWAWIAVFVVVFGPFVLVFAAAFLGIYIYDVPGFATWFMLALTACAVIMLVSSIVEGWKQRRVPWVEIPFFAALTYFWGSIALKGFQ